LETEICCRILQIQARNWMPRAVACRHHLPWPAKDELAFENNISSVARGAPKRNSVNMILVLKATVCLLFAPSCDATWHKRGSAGNFGVDCVNDILTDHVTDTEIISDYCHERFWQRKGFERRVQNVFMFREGYITKCESNVHFLCVKSMTFNHIQRLNSCGNEFPTGKEECVNHITKRLVFCRKPRWKYRHSTTDMNYAVFPTVADCRTQTGSLNTQSPKNSKCCLRAVSLTNCPKGNLI
jgi:hypothetical protein